MEKILLFYKYVTLADPGLIVQWQRQLCTQLNLKGRIIIASEGINGTLGGHCSDLERYKQAMEAHPLFTGIDFKESQGERDDFPRLKVVLKEEIVRLGIPPQQVSVTHRGKHLTPSEAHDKIAYNHNNPNFVIFDARNDYEWNIGAFEGAVTPHIKTFRELPAFIDNNPELFKDKEVLMYCTGGVRCERASAYLKSKNLAQEVYQLSGGIHRYVEQFPHGFFKGKNFVFDARLAIPVNDDIKSHCALCNAPWDTYTHCISSPCNRLIILCSSCKKSTHNTCSPLCKDQISAGTVPIRAPHSKREQICG